MLDDIFDGTPWADSIPERTGISGIPVDDGPNTPDVDPAVVNPQTIGQPLRTWQSIRANNEHTRATFDDTSRTLVYRSATIPPFSGMQDQLNLARQKYGEVKFFRLQFRRGELDNRNGIIGLLQKGFKQLDGLPGLVVFEKDLTRRAKRQRMFNVQKPEPIAVEPLPEFKMTVSEYQQKQTELDKLRARIQKLWDQCASEGIS